MLEGENADTVCQVLCDKASSISIIPPPHPTPTRGGMSTLFSTPQKVLFLVHFLPFWHRRFVLDLFGRNLRSFGISVFDPVEFRAIWPFLSKLLQVKKWLVLLSNQNCNFIKKRREGVKSCCFFLKSKILALMHFLHFRRNFVALIRKKSGRKNLFIFN